MEADPSVCLVGMGIDDAASCVGTTRALRARFGAGRVIESPVAEASIAGIAHGMALGGQRPVVIFQRNEFALYAISQILNHAVPWSYMTGMKVPVTYRMVIGRKWGQGPQHSAAYHSLFAHLPGLEIFLPCSVTDAYEATLRSIRSEGPSIVFESKYMVDETWEFPALEQHRGGGVAIVSAGEITVEACRAAAHIRSSPGGPNAFVVPVPVIRPFPGERILAEVRDASRFVVCDVSHPFCSVASEIVAQLALAGLTDGRPVRRVTRPDAWTPSARPLEAAHYPDWRDIVEAAGLPRPAGGRDSEAKPRLLI
jgi:pyruvate dehydrogenase E1 component beta subunit